MPIKFGGNEAGRGNGERMAVDPNDGRILFLGTRKNGLWKSADGAATWTKVESFPADVLKLSAEEAKLPAWSGGGRSSIVFVVFDPTSGGKGKASQTLFAGVSVMGKPASTAATTAAAAGRSCRDSPPSTGPTTRSWPPTEISSSRYGTDPGPMPMVDGAVWKLDTRKRRLDRHHPGQAGPGTQVRLRGGCRWTRAIPRS